MRAHALKEEDKLDAIVEEMYHGIQQLGFAVFPFKHSSAILHVLIHSWR